jgi:ribose transport system permease protein
MTTTASPGRVAIRRRALLMKYSTLIVLGLLFLTFSIWVDRFFTAQNVVNILQQISMLTIVGVGLTFAFATKEMDLSVGYTTGLASLLVPMLLVAGWPITLAVSAGVFLGLLVGVLNAVLVSLVGIPSLIATLATGSMLFGMNLLITGGRAIYGGLPAAYLEMGQGRIGLLPVVSIIMLLIVAVAWFVMERTLLGRYLYAVGGNARASELSGITARHYQMLGLVVCSLFAAIAGILLAARLGSGQPNAGERYLLDGMATVFIGMTMIRPGTATIMGTFFGALFVGIVNNGLNLMSLDTNVQSIAKGAIILIAVSIISRRTKLRLM